MNTLDYVLLAVIGVAALRCLFRGVVAEVMSAAAIVGGLLAAILFYKPVGGWIGGLVDIGGFSLVAGFLASFALVFILAKILERSLRAVLEKLSLSALDKALGFAFGAVEGLLIASVILILVRYQPLFPVDTLLDGSWFARVLLPVIAERMPAAGA